MATKYPSYESLMAANTPAEVSADFLRLRWLLQNDDLADSVKILDDPTDADSALQVYRADHPICKTSLTWPPVSSITVSIEILDDYSSNWIPAHQPHAEPDDDENEAHFDDQGNVDFCCGQHRPGPGPQITVSAGLEEYVTNGRFIELCTLGCERLMASFVLPKAWSIAGL